MLTPDQELTLEIAVEDALFRIKREYKRTNGQIYLGFSGGKDSTVMAHLIKMAELPTDIPFVFANTGIELEATLRFVQEFDYPNIHIVKPRKPFAQVLKENGKPALSKLKSEALSTYHKNIDNNPMQFSRVRQLVTGERERGGVKLGTPASQRLANKHYHFLHPDLGFQVSNRCCSYLKKYPFADFEKEHQMRGSFNGMRTAEGGTRSLMLTSCVRVDRKKGEEFYFSTPIFDWSNEVVDLFIKKYNIRLSDAYEKYGMVRTGCMGCPYGRNVEQELKILYDHEPNRYKATMFWLKDVYMNQMVECEWDEDYMEEYRAFELIREQRRQEMLNTYRPKN